MLSASYNDDVDEPDVHAETLVQRQRESLRLSFQSALERTIQ